MWWERCIPKSYLIKNAICGVECVFDETGVSYHYIVLKSNKNKVEIFKQGTTTNISEILSVSKKTSASISLVVSGKGIILKKIIFSKNDSLQIKDLLQQHLPTISFNEFYIQFYKNEGNSGHLSVCRKEQIKDLMSLFTNDKQEVVNLFIGPLICNSLSQITFSYNRLTTNLSELELVNGFIESIKLTKNSESTNLEINDLRVITSQILAFAAGFEYLTQQSNYSSDNIELNILPINHVEKLKIKLLLSVMVIILFVVCGTNAVLFFQKFDENNINEIELNLYESKNNQITQLLENYQKKKNLIEQAGIFDNKKLSVYADKIAISLPDKILLRELYFNPEEGETEVDSLTNFTENQLIIKGNCSKSLILNEWINVLKSQNFVKNVNLETFIYNSEGHLPNFVLKINTQ